MAHQNARRPTAALTAHRPPMDSRAGIAAAHKTGRTKRQVAQRRHDAFGTRQAARASVFMARRRVTAPVIAAGARMRREAAS